MSAICWCDSRDTSRRISVARCLFGSAAIALRTATARSSRSIARCAPSIADVVEAVRRFDRFGRPASSRSTRLRQTFTAMRYSHVESAACALEILQAAPRAHERFLRESLASSWLFTKR